MNERVRIPLLSSSVDVASALSILQGSSFSWPVRVYLASV